MTPLCYRIVTKGSELVDGSVHANAGELLRTVFSVYSKEGVETVLGGKGKAEHSTRHPLDRNRQSYYRVDRVRDVQSTPIRRSTRSVQASGLAMLAAGQPVSLQSVSGWSRLLWRAKSAPPTEQPRDNRLFRAAAVSSYRWTIRFRNSGSRFDRVPPFLVKPSTAGF